MIVKECRALLPAWAAAAGAILLCALFRDLSPFGVPAYFIGAVTLGAMSMGHEYSHRTMGLMLTLPVARSRVLLTKLAVLAAMLMLLALLARLVIPFGRDAARFAGAIVGLPVVSALFITPYLTIVTRSPVGGAVFTLGIAGMVTVAGEWIGINRFGYTANVDSFRVNFVWYALSLLSALSAALMWQTSSRLQVLDGPGRMIDFSPAATSPSPSLSRKNPMWLLVMKELRVQQLAFAVAALYVVMFAITAVRTRGTIQHSSLPLILSVMYAGMLTLLIGATASAEERHLRTLDAQLLVPMPLSRQWMIKIGVVVALTAVLALLLPLALVDTFTTSPIALSATQTLLHPRAVLMLLAISALSVYVSTVTASGLSALLVSVPSAFAAVSFVMKLSRELQKFVYSLDGSPDWRIVDRVTVVAALGVIGLVLGFAFSNHRTADRTRTRVAAQVGIAAAAALAATAVVGVVAALSR